MATKIYENSKRMTGATYKDDAWLFKQISTPAPLTRDISMPLIAKGNIYQGITAQW